MALHTKITPFVSQWVSFKVLSQIKKSNEIIIRHDTFTKLPLLYNNKTNLKLYRKLCERKVGVFIEGKVGRKKIKVVL